MEASLDVIPYQTQWKKMKMKSELKIKIKNCICPAERKALELKLE